MLIAVASKSGTEVDQHFGHAEKFRIFKYRKGDPVQVAEVAEKKKHANDNVEAGREFVEAYVEYVHFVEGIHNMVAKGPAHDLGGKHEH